MWVKKIWFQNKIWSKNVDPKKNIRKKILVQGNFGSKNNLVSKKVKSKKFGVQKYFELEKKDIWVQQILDPKEFWFHSIS